MVIVKVQNSKQELIGYKSMHLNKTQVFNEYMDYLGYANDDGTYDKQGDKIINTCNPDLLLYYKLT